MIFYYVLLLFFFLFVTTGYSKLRAELTQLTGIMNLLIIFVSLAFTSLCQGKNV